MSYLVLARKYRPQTFDQVIGQKHVTQTLTNAIAHNRVHHAILFAGPRGTGKTTIARILAKAMNCKNGPVAVPCNVCSSCMEITSSSAIDVFEIDGASNNSVDQIRELRENIKYMPAHSLYKIYIIDEVHMLSLAAFNALLKTLEEPPAHVMFMFATTEPNKIPITILSRCQRHDFRRIDAEAIAEHMLKLCADEGVTIAIESLGLIAREAGGSMRDALSLLDQVMAAAQGEISHDHVVNILGVVDRKIIFDISDAVIAGDIPELLDILDELYDYGHDMKKLYADIVEHFRNMLVAKMGKQVNKLVDLPAHELEMISKQIKGVSATYLNQVFDILFQEESIVKYSERPKLAIEMAFIRILQLKPALPIELLIEKLDDLIQNTGGLPAIDLDATYKTDYKTRVEHRTENNLSGKIKTDKGVRENGERESAGREKQQPQQDSKTRILPAQPVKPLQTTNIDPFQFIEKSWEKIRNAISPRYPALCARLKNSSIKKMNGQGIEIAVNGDEYNYTTLINEKNLSIIRKVCKDYFGDQTEIEIVAGNNMEKNKKKNSDKIMESESLRKEALNHPLINDITEIFSGKVLDVKIL
ncbi:MAG: DNA polymerase III subunit gamma/tau [Desulfosarcina sp.]|nr:DNA polymerase III subunit gamma/tau [Desulfobacterales bacterium]